MVSDGRIGLNDVGIGEIVKEAVVSVDVWQHGGNTLLGTVLLLSPIAVAAGMTLAKEEKLSLSRLRENMKLAVESTTPSDAVAVYEAINIANPAGLAGKAPAFDVNDPRSKETILEKGVALYDIFEISAPYDTISREWVENYPITFETGLPYFTRQLEKAGDLNTAIIHTFLKVLSTVPDTLIARKIGWEKAKEVSMRAEEVLRLGGLTTSKGREGLAKFDGDLRSQANLYNPGTTADIIATVLAIAILDGYRP